MKNETEPNSQYKSPEQGSGSRYMLNDKKHYYLASVDENVQTLIKEQIDSLTRVLIELKSQYDIITRETSIKDRETKELCKKIEMLQEMDNKSKKKIEEANEASRSIKAAIDAKKKKLEEEQYERKTLQIQIEALKEDILLTKKEIVGKDTETKRLNKYYQKEREKKNALQNQQNQIYSKIISQTQKNFFNQNEQNLQLQYYNQIIEQKTSFLRAADERKQRQLKIAQEAKNDSQDKQEIELRKQLGYFTLYNKYLRTKMERELSKNEKLEETYQKIRDICGTSNLRVMVDKILYREKRYNECVARVAELESLNEICDNDISELTVKLTELKNQVLVKESEDEKTLSTIPTSILEEKENDMLKEESVLRRKLDELQEKKEMTKLVFEKILENIKQLTKNVSLDTELATTQVPIKSEDAVDTKDEQEITIPKDEEDVHVVQGQKEVNVDNNDNNEQKEEEKEKERSEKEKDIEVKENQLQNNEGTSNQIENTNENDNNVDEKEGTTSPEGNIETTKTQGEEIQEGQTTINQPQIAEGIELTASQLELEKLKSLKMQEIEEMKKQKTIEHQNSIKPSDKDGESIQIQSNKHMLIEDSQHESTEKKENEPSSLIDHSIYVTETHNNVESEMAMKLYFEFLKETMSKFETLYLLKTKEQFLKIMQERGIKAANEQEIRPRKRRQTKTKIKVDYNNITNTTNPNQLTTPLTSTTKPNNYLTYGNEMEIEMDDDMYDRDIYITFLLEQKAKKNEFVKKK